MIVFNHWVNSYLSALIPQHPSLQHTILRCQLLFRTDTPYTYTHILKKIGSAKIWFSAAIKKMGREKTTNPFTKVSDVPPDFTAVKFFASLMRTSNIPPDGRWESPFFPFLKLFFPTHRTELQHHHQELYIYTARLIWKSKLFWLDFFFIIIVYCNGIKVFLMRRFWFSMGRETNKAGTEKSLHIWQRTWPCN